MNCNITDEQRIRENMFCRSFTCIPCRDFKKLNNEYAHNAIAQTAHIRVLDNLAKEIDKLEAENKKMREALKEIELIKKEYMLLMGMDEADYKRAIEELKEGE